MDNRTYIAIDLKSFYASVECRELGYDPLDTCLCVADESRTDKTICLAVSPALKSFGIPGRPRLFEVRQQMRVANAERLSKASGRRFSGSFFYSEIAADPGLKADFIIAKPRMAYYMAYSKRIYEIYLRYIAPEDIIVYSIDEVFMDVTEYLNTYGLSPPRACHEDHPGGAFGDRHHGYGRHRQQPVPLQGGYGYRGKAYPCR